MIVIQARPHINGNEPRTFREIAQELYSDATALNTILGRVRGTIMHGRNYQHLGADGYTARQEDLDLLEALAAQVSAIHKLAEGINKAGEE